MKYSTIILALLFATLAADGQSTSPDNILLKIEILKRTLSQADTLKPEDLQADSSLDINGMISKQLSEILSFPTIMNYNLDSLLNHNFLGITHSKDKRIWIFNWDENTGGTFKSNISLIHYRTASNNSNVIYDYYSENEKNSFCSEGAWFREIYKLESTTKDIYLCLGSTVGCATCYAEVLSIVELTKDGINFNYPAFNVTKKSNHRGCIGFSPCFTLDSRQGDIEKFDYNIKTQTISYSYFPDDNTPISNAEKKGKVIGKLQFDGNMFIETVK